MIEGSFFAYCERPVAGFLHHFFGSRGLSSAKAAKAVQRRLDAVLSCSPASDGSLPGSPESPGTALANALGTSPSLAKVSSLPQSFVFPGAGIVVRHGLAEVANGLYRVSPHVFAHGDAVIVFLGHLSNVSELLRGVRGRLNGNLMASVEDRRFATPTSSLERNRDLGAVTASTVLHLYLNTKEGEECVFLSELQGQYAFVIYDNSRGSVFAARDPSSDEHLFYHLDEQSGALSLTNEPFDTPDVPLADWVELPPGHFLSGRPPRLQQFALTPDELAIRERVSWSTNYLEEGYSDRLSLSSSLEEDAPGLLAAAKGRRGSVELQHASSAGSSGRQSAAAAKSPPLARGGSRGARGPPLQDVFAMDVA